MKQILQNLKTGATEITEVPCPALPPGHLLVRTRLSLVSAGTERSVVEFGRASLVQKARQQPDKVRMVLDKVRTDGLLPTIASVRNKLDQPVAMGYCNLGTVAEVGQGVTGFAVGDRVVSNGKHAELVVAPVNLCARVPQSVADEDAVFTVLGAIALQGIRLVQPTLGEAVVVTGLGLVGLIAVQLLRAHGCRVLGIDFDADKVELARSFGAEVVNLSTGEDPVTVAQSFSRGLGVDAVVVTAATQSSEPIHQAALMCRKRGRIVLVGVTGLELSRADFYEKELTFQVSCSYGPGRYDPEYEENGHDYPVGFVRWTEQRNFDAVLDMLAGRRVDFASLISHRIPFQEASRAYALLADGERSLGIVLEYVAHESAAAREMEKTVALVRSAAGSQTPVVGFVGAGGYGTAVLIPAFRKAGARLKSVASRSGVSAAHAGRKFGFENATTDTDDLLADPDIDTIAVCTRHDSHARFVCAALRAGKHVFVEKPLAISMQGIDEIAKAYAEASARAPAPLLMVGFNRRFAPQIVKMKALLSAITEPSTFVMTVNAGPIPKEHWTQQRDVGGGRIVGEGCHFIDLMRHLAGAAIVRVQAMRMGGSIATGDDKVSLQVAFADGSFGTVHYLANGHRSFPKERLEVFAGGRILQLDNFRRLTGFGWPGFTRMNLWGQDKGQDECAAAFVRAVRQGGPSPIPFEELIEVGRATIEAGELAR